MTIATIKAFQVDTNEIVDVPTFNSRVPWNMLTLPYSTLLVPDFTLSRNFIVTLTGNTTFDNPLNVTPGQSGVIYIVQDEVGSRSAAFNSFWSFEEGVAPTLSTLPGVVDVLVYEVYTTTRVVATLLRRVGG
jgi:hypothetical protein